MAICSPEMKDGHKAANVNVLYELGLADSLGKATLILSNGSKGDLPADIQNRDVVFYTNEDVGTEKNIDKLMGLIKRRISGLGGESLPPDVLKTLQPGDIYVVEARRLLLTEEIFWEKFRCVLNLSRDIHRTFETLILMYSKPLVDLSDEIYKHQAQELNEIVTFRRNWEQFREYFNGNIKMKFLDRQSVINTDVEDAFIEMKTRIEGPRAMSQLDAASGYWDKVREKLDACNVPIDSNNKLYENSTLIEKLETSYTDVSRHVGEIKNNATDVLNFSGYLSKELLEMFAGGD